MGWGGVVVVLGVLGPGAGDLLGALPWLEEGLTGDFTLSFDPRDDLSAFFLVVVVVVVVVFVVPFSLGLGSFFKDRKLSPSESTRKRNQVLNSRVNITLALYLFSMRYKERI